MYKKLVKSHNTYFFLFLNRSISVPGPAPNLENLSNEDNSCNPNMKSQPNHRNFSFNANGHRVKANHTGSSGSSGLSRNRKGLKRSETERLVQNPVANNTTNNLWMTEFDNQAYEKSPEPLLLNSSSAHRTATGNSIADHTGNTSNRSQNNRSLSLNSLNKNPAMMLPLNEENVSFELLESSSNSSSTDSDLELVNSSPLESIAKSQGASNSGLASKNHQISRAKILETVGVIVNKADPGSDANLLLPPSSTDSPSSSSSVSLAGAMTSSASEGSSSIPVSGLEAAESEPRLAFIGCETTSTLSSPLSLSGAMAKRPSLSDRYPTSPSGSSAGSSSNGGSKSDQSDQDLNIIEDNLDIISIITDGMN